MPRILCFIALLFPLVAQADDIPCKFAGYYVVTSNKLAIDCGLRVRAISGNASVSVVVNNSVSGPPVSTGTLSAKDVVYIVIDLKTPLQGRTDYEVQLSGVAGASNTPFDTASFRFSTTPTATIALPIDKKATEYRYGEKLWVTSPVAFDRSSANQARFSSEDAPGVLAPHRVAIRIPDRTPDTGFADYGKAELTFLGEDTPKQLNSRMRVTGLKDIFGEDVTIDKLQKRLAPASSPAGKDDSFYYAKLLHQAGLNSKPAFILDGKVAPVFPIARWNNLQLRPSATADIGQGGEIGETETNDLIQFGFGVGRFTRTDHLGPIQGIDPTAGFIYETNYALVHKNGLFASEAQWFVAGTDQSLKQKNFIKYVNKKKEDPTAEPQDAPKAFFGYRWRFYTGIETGSQFSEDTALASEGNSEVQVPKYSIARIYPKVSLALDFSRLTLNIAGTARYLFTNENVYRERDASDATGAATKEVYLTTVSGLRPSAEIGLAFALDDAGHYALSSTVKLGSLPPNFDRVATVQSGITIKF